MLKVSVILPDAEEDFWRKVKSTAALRGQSVGEFAQGALKREILRQPPARGGDDKPTKEVRATAQSKSK